MPGGVDAARLGAPAELWFAERLEDTTTGALLASYEHIRPTPHPAAATRRVTPLSPHR
ncbi:hypothetical protein [Dactylosporangium matsuzakiense]|uniref:hypothetical protein n=1 Tax=Dactylosporangium matsuzakiense TaxID=53360 RepID=UPI0022F2DDA1|nr:hypothetical protein [Dactylosporangium matsuzakiense]